MLFSTALLALPLLASAAPAGLTLQHSDDSVPVIDSADPDHVAASYHVDLSEVRLVQFHPDEPPV
jgi:hypothetical protein